MVKYTDYEKARNIDIFNVLRICNMYPDRYGRYICPFHRDTEASAYVRVNRLFCFACSNEEPSGWSTIDVVMQVKNVSKEDAVKIILELCGGYTACFDNEIAIKNEKQRVKTEKEENEDYEEVRESFLKKARAIKDSDKDLFIKYLKTRNINERVLKVLDKNGIIYGTDEYNQPAFVFDYKHCVFRHSKDNANHSMVITRGAGSYTKIKSNEIPVFFVVEGIYDALTLLDRDTSPNIICLNSIKNLNDFIETIENDWNSKKHIYILALDNDEKGIKATEKLIKILEKNSIRYSKYMELVNNPDCKDVNEMRQKGII